MRRRFTLYIITIALLGLTTSCLKEGLDDFAGINKPWVLHGEFSPEMGLPIGSGTIQMRDLMGSLPIDSALMSINGNDMIVVHYDTTIHQTITPGSSDTTSRSAKNQHDSIATYVQTITGDLEVNIFSMLDQLPDDFQVKNAYANMVANVQAYLNQTTRDILTNYGVHAYMDNIVLTAINEESGQSYVLPIKPQTICVNDLIGDQAVRIDLINYQDVSQMVNVKPNKITYSVQTTIVISHELFDLDLAHFDFDDITIDSAVVDLDFGLNFPVSVSFSDYSFSTTIPLDINQDFDMLTTDSSLLVIDLGNGLPIELDIQVDVYDSLGNMICAMLDGGKETIRGAQLEYYPAQDCYVASQPTNTQLGILLNTQKINAILHGKEIHLTASMATASLNNEHPIVSLKGSDSLSMRIYTILKPNLTIDQPMKGNR